MELMADKSLQLRLAKRSRWLSATVVLIATLVLLGWEFNVDLLKRMVPGLVAMNPLTASCFVLLGCSFFLMTQKSNTRSFGVGYLLASLVILLAGIKIADVLYDFSIQPDMLLFPEKIKATVINGRPNYMAPNTALCLILTGIALLLLQVQIRTRILPTQFISLLVAFMGILSILGYIYRIKSLYEVPLFIPMALHTAICFFFLSIAILFVHPGRGMMRDFTSTLTGSITSHLLIPAAILIPSLLGFMRLYGDWAGWYSKEFGVAVFALSIIITFLGLIWYNTVLLNKRDMAKIQTERDLQKSREEIGYLAGLVDKSSDAIISFDEQFRIRTWNKGAELIFGYRQDEVLGQNSGEFFRNDIPENELMAMRDEIVNNGHWSGEFPQYNRKGESIIGLVSTTALKNEAGITTGYLTTIKDITDRKQHENELRTSEDELKKANSEMEAFTYSVSHDLRAPLRSIIGFTTILEDEYTSQLDEEAKRIMAVIKKNTVRMGMLIDDLLAFSRMSKRDIVKTDVDTNEMLKEVIAELGEKANFQKIKWNIHDLPAMHADVKSMKQVWINLVSNAIKYSGKAAAPEITIDAKPMDDQIVYSVKDNGVGFDQKYSEKLFKVFQRLHSASEFEGTGVGLAIVEKVISKHGGKVWVEAAVNEGATFYFSLPA